LIKYASARIPTMINTNISPVFRKFLFNVDRISNPIPHIRRSNKIMLSVRDRWRSLVFPLYAGSTNPSQNVVNERLIIVPF